MRLLIVSVLGLLIVALSHNRAEFLASAQQSGLVKAKSTASVAEVVVSIFSGSHSLNEK